jgi:hypothetical protein
LPTAIITGRKDDVIHDQDRLANSLFLDCSCYLKIVSYWRASDPYSTVELPIVIDVPFAVASDPLSPACRAVGLLMQPLVIDYAFDLP